jgi:hypothetical protein
MQAEWLYRHVYTSYEACYIKIGEDVGKVPMLFAVPVSPSCR